MATARSPMVRGVGTAWSADLPEIPAGTRAARSAGQGDKENPSI